MRRGGDPEGTSTTTAVAEARALDDGDRGERWRTTGDDDLHRTEDDARLARGDGGAAEAAHGSPSPVADASLEETLPSGERLALGLTRHASVAAALVPGGGEPGEPSTERGATLGRYLVLGKLGSGQMGVVVAAHDPTLDRRVAVKVVRPDRTGSTLGRQRLVREAQAMARLSHPNVVTVFEVGTVGDHVFLAMEYVRGSTLAEWLADGERSRREIVETFLAAGRGLAAAHRAGIVHRDFKPANVLVGEDGQVRVADFGLATAPVTRGADPAQGAVRETVPAGASVTEPIAMTATGALLGTPAYMSPEQHRGQPADARADQFSFCAALYEALCGQLPFSGDSYVDYAAAVLAGQVREPPRGRDVPGWLRRVLLRGLSVDPAERYPGMDELLAELGRDRTATRRRLLAAGGAVALAGGALAVALWAGGREDPCRAAASAVDGVWNAEVRGQLEQAFVRSGHPGAADAFARVAGLLDERAAGLRAMRRDACEDTHVRREQSADLLDRRVSCVDVRAAELGGLAGVLAGAADDPELVERAVEAVLALPPIAQCDDTAALLAAVPPPADPDTRRRADEVRQELAELEGVALAGRYKDGLTRAIELAERADRVGHAPVSARAHFILSKMLGEAGQATRSIEEAERTTELAARARDDTLAARNWINLYAFVAYTQNNQVEGRVLERVARAAVARAGGGDHLEAVLANAQGAARVAAGDYAAAGELFLTAEKHYAAALGPEHPEVADAANNAAVALRDAGRMVEAREALDRALALRKKVLGPDHPKVATSLYSLAITLDHMNRDEEALAQFREVLAIRQRSLPADHPAVASAHDSVGVMLRQLDRPEEALAEHERALAIYQERAEENQVGIAITLDNIGTTLRKLGRGDEALDHFRRALAIRESKLGVDHPSVADSLNPLGLALFRAGKAEEARASWRRALAIRESKLGPDHPAIASVLRNMALEAYESGRFQEAVDTYDRAIAILSRQDEETPPGLLESHVFRGRALAGLDRLEESLRALELARDGYLAAGRTREAAEVRMNMAEVLWQMKKRPARGRALAEAEAALASYEQLDADGPARMVRDWIRARR